MTFRSGGTRLGEISFTVTFNKHTEPPAQTCKAEPCSHCGGCSTCGDFHGNAYGGCTDETCPIKKLKAGDVAP